MPLHIFLDRELAVAVLNWTLKKFSLVLKKMASQVVLSSITGMTIFH